MTLELHIHELRAELSWNDDPVEREQIRQELKAWLKRGNTPQEALEPADREATI